MIVRNLAEIIVKTLPSFPSVTVIGPRQSGKTTLIKHLFPDFEYINFENPDIRLIAEDDPRSMFKKSNIIFDEVQRVPEFFSYIQTYLDSGKYKIILSGSNQFDLNARISQSLAGRTAIFKLLPLSLPELMRIEDFTSDIDDMMYRGFYPAIFDKHQNPTIANRSYYETYLQKDVRQIANINNISLFDRFVRICAGRTGNLINLSSLCNEVGISINTAKNWLSLLESSFICYTLKPYFNNFSKRWVKSPKLYFYDTGLLAYLIGIQDKEQVSRDPLRGSLFENMVISEFLKHRYNQGLDHNGYFLRDSNGLEIDYFMPSRTTSKAYEIKSAMTYHPTFKKALEEFGSIESLHIKEKTIIYNGLTMVGPNNISISNIMDFFRALR